MPATTADPLPPNPDPVLNAPMSPELVDQHGLLPEEYERICTILGREPTLTELGVFSVMWSEHCSYKNSRPLLRGFPTTKADPSAPGQVLVKAGEENAGVVDLGDGWAVCFKIESHNHPSAIEPFEGAATGVGGIVRDIFTMGARPVLLTNSLRFGDLDQPAVRHLFRGVVAGIAHYGNCLGIPTVGGDVYFDPSYEGNPLVNALCLGVVRKDAIKLGRASGPGNPVYYVGAATGRDGLGGAAFASKELTEESAADRPAVQKGDPFMEKLLLEACLEMMAVPGLVVGIQDMGAAGLTCSTCETASRGGMGIEIELDHVPQREPGMNSYEILLSESQERMLVIVQAGREHELEEIFAKWDLPAARVGVVTETGLMVVRHHGIEVARIPAKALADEGPVYHREAREPAYLATTQAWPAESLPDLQLDEVEAVLTKLLGHPTLAEKRWIWRQYDHMVRAATAVEPGGDAAVVRLQLDQPDGGKVEKSIAIANDGNGRYVYLNPYRGGLIAVAECLRNLACVGARPLALTDNLNYGNPYKPEVFYQLRESVRGLADACRHFDVPVCGGNVSLYNERSNGGIDPTPTVSIAGILDHPENVPTSFAGPLEDGSWPLLLLVGGVPDELGASQYLGIIHGLKTGDTPSIDLDREAVLHAFLREQIGRGVIASAHDLSDGGLLVAVAEMLFGPRGTLGARLELALDPENPGRLDAALFGEVQTRVLLAVAERDAMGVINAAAAAGLPAQILGQVQALPQLDLAVPELQANFRWDTAALRHTWSEAIPSRMARPGLE